MKFLFIIITGLLGITVFAQDWNIVNKDAEAAAKELGEHLTKATGRPFKLWKEGEYKGDSAFYVGLTDYAKENGFTAKTFNPDGWAYKSVGKNVILTGHPHEGIQNAVYSFLENELGIRWYTFESTYIPKAANPDFSKLNREGCPAFVVRSIYMPYWEQHVQDAQRIRLFQVRNKWNAHSSVHIPTTDRSGCHNFYLYVNPDKYFKTHPEYFSMDGKGKRFCGDNHGYGGQLCMTNPVVADIAAKSLEEYIIADRKKYPKDKWPVVYDISQLDGTSYLCLCPNCKALTEKEGSDSALVLTFINRIAKKIAIKYPDVTIRTMAYISSLKAPKNMKPEKNVLIQICDLYTRSDCFRPLTHEYNAEQRKIFEGWKEKGARITVWDYWNMAHEGANPFFTPPRIETMVDAIAGDLRYLRKIGVEDYFAEAEVCFLQHPPNFYDLQFWLGLKLLDNPDLDEHKLIAEFMKNHYGPAAVPMTQFLNHVRKAVKEENAALFYISNPVRTYQTPAFLKQSYAFLKEAQELTKPGSPYRLRVEKEMVTPLAVMMQNGETGIPLKTLSEEYRTCRLGQINAYGDKAEMFELKKKLDNDVAKLTVVLDVPEKFKNIPPNKLKQYAWPVFYDTYNTMLPLDDPESPTGKALSSLDKGSEGRDHIMKPQVSNLLPTSFGLYDSESQKGIALHIKDIPADEKYHWYEIGKFDFGKQTFLWAWFWLRGANLRSVWSPADGLEGFNTWTVWISVKVTGPAYVKGSQKKNAVLMDRIILVKE